MKIVLGKILVAGSKLTDVAKECRRGIGKVGRHLSRPVSGVFLTGLSRGGRERKEVALIAFHADVFVDGGDHAAKEVG